MLGEAINHLKTLPRDAAQRADVFEALARQIEIIPSGLRPNLGSLTPLD